MGPIMTSTLEKHIKKTTILTNVVTVFIACVTSLTVVYGFYYKTTDTLETHSKDITEVKSEVKDVAEQMNSAAVFQSVSESESRDVKERLKRVEDKQDKILDLIIDIKQQTKIQLR